MPLSSKDVKQSLQLSILYNGLAEICKLPMRRDRIIVKQEKRLRVIESARTAKARTILSFSGGDFFR